MDQVHVIRHKVLVEGLSARGVAQQMGVPRLTQGLRLPVIVHPDAPKRLEIQWHLV
jgi:hypothetical protein